MFAPVRLIIDVPLYVSCSTPAKITVRFAPAAIVSKPVTVVVPVMLIVFPAAAKMAGVVLDAIVTGGALLSALVSVPPVKADATRAVPAFRSYASICVLPEPRLRNSAVSPATVVMLAAPMFIIDVTL